MYKHISTLDLQRLVAFAESDKYWLGQPKCPRATDVQYLPDAQLNSATPATATLLNNGSTPGIKGTRTSLKNKPKQPLMATTLKNKPKQPLMATTLKNKPDQPLIATTLKNKPNQPLIATTLKDKSNQPLIDTTLMNTASAAQLKKRKVSETGARRIAREETGVCQIARESTTGRSDSASSAAVDGSARKRAYASRATSRLRCSKKARLNNEQECAMSPVRTPLTPMISQAKSPEQLRESMMRTPLSRIRPNMTPTSVRRRTPSAPSTSLPITIVSSPGTALDTLVPSSSRSTPRESMSYNVVSEASSPRSMPFDILLHSHTAASPSRSTPSDTRLLSAPAASPSRSIPRGAALNNVPAASSSRSTRRDATSPNVALASYLRSTPRDATSPNVVVASSSRPTPRDVALANVAAASTSRSTPHDVMSPIVVIASPLRSTPRDTTSHNAVVVSSSRSTPHDAALNIAVASASRSTPRPAALPRPHVQATVAARKSTPTPRVALRLLRRVSSPPVTPCFLRHAAHLHSSSNARHLPARGGMAQLSPLNPRSSPAKTHTPIPPKSLSICLAFSGIGGEELATYVRAVRVEMGARVVTSWQSARCTHLVCRGRTAAYIRAKKEGRVGIRDERWLQESLRRKAWV